MSVNVYNLIEEADDRIRPYIYHTPLCFSPKISQELQANIYLKLENEQKTGSFKIRGAFNKALVLSEEIPDRFVAASTGNHGLACAFAFNTVGIDGDIVVPVTASKSKLDKLKLSGANIIQHGNDCEETEKYARDLCKEKNGRIYISPYNDYEVIAGQGTIGKEILKDLPTVDVILVSVGGGGLISGIASYVKSIKQQCKIIGCSPKNSKVMHESVKCGKIVSEESFPTLSDGTAGGVEESAVTLGLCERFVDDWILVSEEEISESMYYCLEQHSKIIKGSAGVALAAVRKLPFELKNKNIVVVICGGNLSIQTLYDNVLKTRSFLN